MPISTTYTSRELTCERDGLTIYGQLILPADADEATPLPTLVCAHGFGGNYLKCLPYAWAMAEAGWAAYCFDFCGGGYAVRSKGNPLDMTPDTERDDLAAVIAELSNKPFVDTSCLCLLGEGQGGLVATLFAREEPDAPQAMALIHPTFNLQEQMRRTFPTKKNIPASFRHAGMRVGRQFGEVLFDTNAYQMMPGYAGDVLIVSGTDDTSVPKESLTRAVDAFPAAELSLIPGGRHVLTGPTQERAIELVRDFFEGVRAAESADAS